MTKADLHIHSNYSDGSDSVENLLEIISEANIGIAALTDHDTVAGCEKLETLSLPSGVKVIKGIELTCEQDDLQCHILGYNCDIKNDELLTLIEKGKKLRRTKLEKRLQFLKDNWKIILTDYESDWLFSRQSVVKTHIAEILVSRGLADNNLAAMNKFLDGCVVENCKFTIQEALSAIKNSGGIPIWAHPLGGEGERHINESEFISRLKYMKELGIVGMECYYSRYNLSESELLIKQANINNLLVSGGSDYHGKNKDIPIGRLNSEDLEIGIDKLSVLKAL